MVNLLNLLLAPRSIQDHPTRRWGPLEFCWNRRDSRRGESGRHPDRDRLDLAIQHLVTKSLLIEFSKLSLGIISRMKLQIVRLPLMAPT